MQEPQPGLVGDTHRIANALETLVDIGIAYLKLAIAQSGRGYSSGAVDATDAIEERIQRDRAGFYDPRVPSVKAEDDEPAN